MAASGFTAVNGTPPNSALAEINGNTNNKNQPANTTRKRHPGLNLRLNMDSESDTESEVSEPAPRDNIVKSEPKLEGSENQAPSPSPGLPELRPSKDQGWAASEAHLRKKAYDVVNVSASSPVRPSETHLKKRSHDVANVSACSPASKKAKTRRSSKSIASTKMPAWMSSSQSSTETYRSNDTVLKSNAKPSKAKHSKDKSTPNKPRQDKPTQDKPKSDPPTPKHYLPSDSLIQALDGRFYFNYKQDDGTVIETHKVPLPSYYKVQKDTDKPFYCPVAGCGKCFAGFKNLSGHFSVKHIDRAFRDNCDGTMTEVGSCSRKPTGRLALIVSRTKQSSQPPNSLGRSFFQNMVPWPLHDTSGKLIRSKVLSYIDSQWVGAQAVPSGLKCIYAMADMSPRRGLPVAWADYYETMPLLPLQYAYTVAYLTGREIPPEKGCEQARTWGHLSPACIEPPELGAAELEELNIFKGCVSCRYHSALAGYQIKCDLNDGKTFPELVGQIDSLSDQIALNALNKSLPVETPVSLPPQLSSGSNVTSDNAPEAMVKPSPDVPMVDAEAAEGEEPALASPVPSLNNAASPSLPSLDQIQQELIAKAVPDETEAESAGESESQSKVLDNPVARMDSDEEEDAYVMPDAREIQEEIAAASPQIAPTRSSALPARRHKSPEIGLAQDSDEQQTNDNDMEMEAWEIAPGRVEDAQRKNIGFANGYVVGANPVSIAPDIEFNVVIIKPGKRHHWAVAEDKQRICSVAQGKVNVQIGEAHFKLGESGAFTVYPGESCAIERNTLYRDVVLHCTTVSRYRLRREEVE